MAEGKILGTDLVDQSAHEEFKKLTTEAEALVKSFVDLAGGANAFREALSKSEGIKGTTDAIKNRRKELTEMEKLQKQVIDTNQRIVNMETQMGKAVVQKNLQLQETRKRTQEEIQAGKMREGSYAQLDLQLKQMVRSYKALSEAERNAAKGTELLTKIQNVRGSLGAMDATMGSWTRNVGNYQNQTFQLTQVLREMPAFAVSAQTGILGLSNNLPMLADAFRQTAKDSGGALNALKIFGASLFSFGSIFSIAIGLFTIFSKEIVGFIKGTEDAADGVDVYKEALEGATSEMAKLRLNLELTQKGVISKDQFLKQYNETLGKVTGTTDDFNVAEQKTIDNSDNYIRMMVMKAKSAKMLEIAVKKATEATEMTDDWWTTLKAQTSQGAKAFAQTGNPLLFFTQDPQDSYNAYKRRFEEEGKQAEDAWRKSQEELMKFMQQNDFTDYQDKPGKPKRSKEVNRIEGIKKQYEMEHMLLETQLNDGLITEQQYYDQSIDLARKYRGEREGLSKKEKESEVALNLELSKAESESYEDLLAWLTKGVEAQADADDRKLKSLQKYVEERKKKNAEYAQTELDLIRENLEAQQRMLDGADEEERKRIAKKVEAWQAYADIANSLNAAGSALADIGYQREISAITERDRTQQAAYENEKKRIESQFINKAERERELAKLEATREAEKKKIDADRLRAERKRAQLQKGFDIAGIITSTALAIMTALTEKGPLGIARAAAAGITGVTQLTRAIAAPLPQYWEGTENHPGGPAIVGEKGVELVQEPGGKSYLTPSTATLMNLPARTKVIPHEDLIAAAHAAAYKKMAQFNGPVNTSSQQDAIIQAFDEKLDELIKAYKMSDRTPNISVIVDSNHRAWVEANIS